MDLRSGTFALPFGEIAIAFDETDLRWAGRRLTDLAAVAELKIRGLKTRYLQPGVGASLPATPVTDPGDALADDFLSLSTKVPVPAFLRLERPRSQLNGSRLEGRLEAYIPRTTVASDENAVIVGNRRVPLEVEPTATLAYALAESPMWEQEIARFFDNLGVGGKQRATLALGEPYRPGKIPVVLVHGTASSVGRWAAMLNQLIERSEDRPALPVLVLQYRFKPDKTFCRMKLPHLISAILVVVYDTIYIPSHLTQETLERFNHSNTSSI